jgi:transposase-like protein
MHNDRLYNDNYKGKNTGYGYLIYEPYTNKYLLMNIYKERTVLTCYNFIKKLKRLYGSRYTVYTDEFITKIKLVSIYSI